MKGRRGTCVLCVMGIFLTAYSGSAEVPKAITQNTTHLKSMASDNRTIQAGHTGQAGQKPSSRLVSPFSRHEERYRELYEKLKKGGMSEERISPIFTSPRARVKDMTPVILMGRISHIAKHEDAEMQANKVLLTRVPEVLRHLDTYRRYYDMAEQRFGVNREIIAAILLKETGLGTFKDWQHEAFTVLNTFLSFFDVPDTAAEPVKTRGQRLISATISNLAALILFCEDRGIDIRTARFPSSYAGAIGIPQFSPFLLPYAVSADGGPLPDLTKMPDAILSVASLLKTRFAWPGGLEYEKLLYIDHIVELWYPYAKQKEVSFALSRHRDGRALRRFDEEHGDIPYIGYVGKYVVAIMNYNYSSTYALGVLQIASRAHELKNNAYKEQQGRANGPEAARNQANIRK